jgi:hypothetical protein
MIVWFVFPLVATAFVACWYYWATLSQSLAWTLAGAADLAEAGQWGDSFGGFNALIGALGFCGIVATLLAQTTSLSRQQRDLHVQRFEQSFFVLLKLLREARNEARFKYSEAVSTDRGTNPSEVVTGQQAFRHAWIEMRYWVTRAEKNDKVLDDRAIGMLYARRIHAPFESTWGVYYRLIHSMLDRINTDAVLRRREKIRYANILRGQLTSFEASLGGFNALTPFAGDFKHLITKFRLLKYARPKSTLGKVLRRIYPKATFLSRQRFPWW